MEAQICPDCGCQLKKFEKFEFGNVMFDGFGGLHFDGVELWLPRSQYLVVEALVRAQGCGLTRSTLAGCVGENINDQTISKYIERLRRTFKQIDEGFSQIVSLKGFGAYKWQMKHASVSRHISSSTIMGAVRANAPSGF